MRACLSEGDARHAAWCRHLARLGTLHHEHRRCADVRPDETLDMQLRRRERSTTTCEPVS